MDLVLCGKNQLYHNYVTLKQYRPTERITGIGVNVTTNLLYVMSTCTIYVNNTCVSLANSC